MSRLSTKEGDCGTPSNQTKDVSCEVNFTNQLDEVLADVKEKSEKVIDQMVTQTREHPDKALVYALATGYVLRVMPLAKIVSGVVGLAMPLIKPAVMFYGISKAIKAVKN